MRRVEILEVAARLFSSSGFRTSLQELSEACGILPGSLYHHFESKEAIIVELIKRYQTELDLVAERALDDLHHGAPISPLQRITALAEAIVACATHHRAPLLQTLYEPPVSASKELLQVATQTPRTVDKAMLEILRVGHASNYIRSDIDLARFAEQICQSMLHTGVGTFHCRPGGQQIPALKCRMLLEGLAVKTEDPAKLDRSHAFAAAEKVIAS